MVTSVTLFILLFFDTMYLHCFIDKMFPVQVLVVLSTMIIIHSVATLNNENQVPVATNNYEVDKDGYEMLNNKTSYDSSEITPSYDFKTTNSFVNITNSKKTTLPVISKPSVLTDYLKRLTHGCFPNIVKNPLC